MFWERRERRERRILRDLERRQAAAEAGAAAIPQEQLIPWYIETTQQLHDMAIGEDGQMRDLSRSQAEEVNRLIDLCTAVQTRMRGLGY